jgi:PAS domain S-box-containing protein
MLARMETYRCLQFDNTLKQNVAHAWPFLPARPTETEMSSTVAETATDPVAPSDYDAAPVGLCVISSDLRFIRVNETMASFNGYAAEEHVGRAVSDVVPELEPAARRIMKTLLSTGEPVGPFEVAGEATDATGERRYWMEMWSPLTDDQGQIIAASVAAFEITERKRLEREIEQALAETKKRLKQQTAIAETGQLAFHDVGFQTILDKAVAAAADGLDVPLTKILAFEDSAEQLKLVAGIGWQDGLVGVATVGTERESQAGYTLKSGELVVVEDLATETRFSGPDLLRAHGVVSGMSVTIAGADGRAYGVFGIHSRQYQAFDQGDANFLLSLAVIISNAVRQENAKAQSTLLIREMSHRAGNMLQLVSSIATQTFRHSSDPDKARAAFNQRLSSLARTNHAISQQGWTNTRFKKVAEETLSPFTDRIRMTGSDVLLPAELSFDLGLVLNELCANSIKYGSLGLDEGVLTLEWRTVTSPDGSRFVAQWIDPVSSADVSSETLSGGFGSKLIKQLVERKWHGELSVLQTDQYHMRISIPLPQSHAGSPDALNEHPG